MTITSNELRVGVNDTISDIMSRYETGADINQGVLDQTYGLNIESDVINSFIINNQRNIDYWDRIRSNGDQENYGGSFIEDALLGFTEKALESQKGASLNMIRQVYLQTSTTISIKQAVTNYINDLPVKSYVEISTGKIVTSELVFSETTHIPYGKYLAGVGKLVTAYSIYETFKSTATSAFNATLGNEDTFTPLKNYLIASATVLAAAPVAIITGTTLTGIVVTAAVATGAGWATGKLIDALPSIIHAAKLAGKSLAETLEIVSDEIKDTINEAWDATGDLAQEVLDAGREVLSDVFDSIKDISGDLYERITNQISEFIENIKESISTALTQGTPLFLDLDGDGVELTSVAGDGAIYWDIDQDGFGEASGWVGADDGLLAIDLNSDGIINDHGELFGTQTTDGFAILSAYDSNLDGIINSNDAGYTQLLVWQDANNDGYSQEDELHTLTELNITSISLTVSQVSYTLEGNTITHESTFVMNGQTRDIVDAWFTYDNANTEYSQPYDLDERTLFMPTLRGYGDLPDLHIAMSLDNGTGGLLESVLDFATEYGTGFGAYEAIRSDVRDILFQWAGETAVDPDSRGPNVDARELAFLEKLTGSPFLRGGYDPNPLARAGETLTRAFSDALTALTARLLMQTEAASIFEGDNLYNPITDTFTGALTLDETALAALEAPVGDELSFWQNVVSFVIGVKGEVNLTVDDIDALDDAITASAPLLDFEAVYASLYDNPAQGSEINGNNAVNDTLNGTVLNDEISGLSGNDALNGGQGNDGLYGGDGNDTLTGGVGDDLLEGGDGNDIYVYNLGDGIDTIRESKESEVNDTIQFGSGITISDLTFVRLSNNDMEISINVVGYEGKIRIENQFSRDVNEGAVEFLKFSDNSTYDLSQIDYTLAATNTAETLYGVERGGGTDDTIYGLGGNDTIYGYFGADTLYGGDGDDIIYGSGTTTTYQQETATNTLDGGAGNDKLYGSYGVDHLYGGAGNDIMQGNKGADHYYIELNGGTDTITETDSHTDTIHLGAGIAAGDLSYIRQGNDLRVLVNGGLTNTINIIGQFSTSSSAGAIEYIVLNDTTSINLSTLSYGTIGTNSNETINGLSTNDTIFAEGGNDTVYGYLGADELHGGDGNDKLYGGGTTSGYYTETSVNKLYGDAGTDELYGSYGTDHLYGGTGDDELYGSRGNDKYYFFRGDGNDVIEETYTDTGDTLYLGETITAADLSYARNVGNDLVISVNNGYGGSITMIDQFGTTSSDGAVEWLYLHDGTQIDLRTLGYTLTGTASGESLYGTEINSTGNDTIYGLGGNDTIQGFLGSDIIYGGDGNDTIHGGGTLSSYQNETTGNFLYGEAGTDTLYGSAGGDVLSGGDGADSLTGRGGADTFLFRAGETGVDTITDFSKTGGDRLDISNLLADFDPVQDDINDFITFTTASGNTTMAVDRDGAGTTYAAQNVVILNSVTGLDADDMLANGTLLAA